jgi:Carboxypeptidase regulatory-like domain
MRNTLQKGSRLNPSTHLRRAAALVVVLMLFPLIAPGAAGQAGPAASIIGQVRDESGALLPGVTVVATSPSLQVAQVTSVTDERGEYRLTPLPIGTYTVAYELTGFQSLRQEAVRLTVGFVAKLDMVMKVGSVSETVTVSGAAPVVDVTSTGTRTEFTRETLELNPTGRNGIVALLAQAPGVRTNLDIGGSTINDVPQFRAFGQSQEAYSTIEGVFTTSPKDTQSGNYYDYSSFEEARVQTVANDAETPRRGIAMTGVVKSGGNDLHGSAFWGQTNDRLQSDNVDDELRAMGVAGAAKITNRWDISGDIGGKIVENKLWFFGSTRGRSNTNEVLNAFKPDGTPALRIQRQTFRTGKLSYQMTPGNRFVGFYSWSSKHEERGVTEFVPWNSRFDEQVRMHTAKGEWQAVRGNALVTDFQYGYWMWHDRALGHDPDNVRRVDIRTLQQSGDSTDEGEVPTEHRHHAKGSIGWYRPGLFIGNHELKAGFDFFSVLVSRAWNQRQSGDYLLRFDNGVPFQMQTWNHPVKPFSNQRYLGTFVKDTWTIARRLTLNLGLRYAHDNAFAPPQCRDAGDFAAAECFPEIQLKIWNSLAPRLHAAYDLMGDGKTVIKGGYGRFDHMREIDPEVTTSNRNVKTATTWAWRDLNRNGDYDAGEVNLDPNGPDFVSIAGSTDAQVNPNELQPKVDEFSLALERVLMPDFAVRMTGIYSRAFNTFRTLNIRRPYEAFNIPVTNPDPGPDGAVGTSDDPGTLVTYYDYPAALQGRQFAATMRINDPEADQTYKSFEIAASKRLSSGWQMLVSYSATKKNVPFGSEALSFDPNAEINVANRTWEWLGKVSGAYLFPYGVLASASFEHRSGTEWARTALFRGGRQIPSITLNVEPIGARRMPHTNLLDLRVEKRFRITTARSLAVRMNVFNAMNANTAITLTQVSGTRFMVPTNIMLPRILELSASFTF